MKELKRTIEEVTGYEANDGTLFRRKEECEKYEHSAKCAAKLAASKLAVRDRTLEAAAPLVGCYDDRVTTYDIKTATDLQVLNTWLELEDPYSNKVDPSYIGQRVAIQYYEYGSGHTVIGTRADMEVAFREKMDKLFADPEEEE